MGSNHFSKPNPAGDYAQQRLRHGRDDRTSQEKLKADAALRGKLGTRRANEVIAVIDGLKSRR